MEEGSDRLDVELRVVKISEGPSVEPTRPILAGRYSVHKLPSQFISTFLVWLCVLGTASYWRWP